MNVYDMVKNMTEEAVDALFRYAYAVPETRRDWRPAPQARTVMEILQENAILPLAIATVLREQPQVADPAVFEEARARSGNLDTVEACERACRAATAEMIRALQDIPADDLHKTVTLPWQATYTLLQTAWLHYWNLTYHLGQVAYIQLLYGDKEYY